MNLNTMSDGDLEQMFRNCVNAIAEGKPNAAEAQAWLSAINAVWKVRLAAAAAGLYKAETPEIGVLKTIGYQVGKDGVPRARRRALLDYAMSGDLPFVGSPAHMLQWGDPGSETRYRKVHRVLARLTAKARALGDHMSAAAETWEEDIAYIEQAWRAKGMK